MERVTSGSCPRPPGTPEGSEALWGVCGFKHSPAGLCGAPVAQARALMRINEAWAGGRGGCSWVLPCPTLAPASSGTTGTSLSDFPPQESLGAGEQAACMGAWSP